MRPSRPIITRDETAARLFGQWRALIAASAISVIGIADPRRSAHRQNTGDGMLVEFASVVDAVRCAVEVQRAMVDRNAETPEDKRITFRIGVNLGDVIIDGDDIYGDGVNIAARLEALAEPGGICISRVVRDQIRDKLPYPFEDMGEQSVKNIARPVRVYAMSAAAVASTPLVAAPAQPESHRAEARPAGCSSRRSPLLRSLSRSSFGGRGLNGSDGIRSGRQRRRARNPPSPCEHPSSRRACRSSSCPLRTCRMIQTRSISPTGSPTI